jgi:hypothetical protein
LLHANEPIDRPFETRVTLIAKQVANMMSLLWGVGLPLWGWDYSRFGRHSNRLRWQARKIRCAAVANHDPQTAQAGAVYCAAK